MLKRNKMFNLSNPCNTGATLNHYNRGYCSTSVCCMTLPFVKFPCCLVFFFLKRMIFLHFAHSFHQNAVYFLLYRRPAQQPKVGIRFLFAFVCCQNPPLHLWGYVVVWRHLRTLVQSTACTGSSQRSIYVCKQSLKSLVFIIKGKGKVYIRAPGWLLPHNGLLGMCRWMGSHFHD